MSATSENPNVNDVPADDGSISGDSTDAPIEEAPATTSTTTAEAPNRYEKLERLKREKRLAMNRECARTRRRRKKLRMEMLENRVQDLTQKNSKMQDANGALRSRVAQLEAELGAARSGMAMSLSSPDGMPSGPPASLLGSMGLSAEATQGLLAEKIQLQRRLAGLGGGGGGFGGPGGFGGAGGGAGGVQDQATALRYMQLMKAKSAMGGGMGEDPMQGMGAGAGASGVRGFNPFGHAGFSGMAQMQQGAGDDPVGRLPNNF